MKEILLNIKEGIINLWVPCKISIIHMICIRDKNFVLPSSKKQIVDENNDVDLNKSQYKKIK